MKSILFILVLMLFTVTVNATEWHDDSRLKRVQLNVNNSSVVLTDYQIMKNITYDSDMQSDFDDILFYNESGGNISYWIESKTDSVSVDIWLKIPSISTTCGSKVWMYYGNPDASSASNGVNTFCAFTEDISTSEHTFMYFNLDSVRVIGNINCSALSSEGPQYDLKPLAPSGYHWKWDYYKLGNALRLPIDAGLYTVGYVFPLNQSVRFETIADGSTFQLYVDDVFKIESTSMTPISFTSLKLTGNSGEDVYTYEFTAVAKYTATKPTWDADGEEESYEAPLQGTFLYPNSTYSIGYYGRLTSELVYETGINFSDINTFNQLTPGEMEVMSVDDTNYIPSIDKDAAHDGYMYGNFSLQNVESVNFINVKTVHNRNGTNPIILGLFNVSTHKWHAVNNSSVEIVDVELTYNITGTDITKYTTLIDNTLNLSVSLNTNGDGNYDVFVDYVEIYIDYEELPDITLEYVYNLTLSNQNNISILQNDVDDLENNMNNVYMFILLCTVFLIAMPRRERDQ